MNWNKMRQYILHEMDGDWAGRDYLEGKGERERELDQGLRDCCSQPAALY